MTRDTRIALFLLNELVAALRANTLPPSSLGCVAVISPLESSS